MELLWIIIVFCLMYVLVVYLCLHYISIIRKETDEWKELAIDVQQKLHKEIAYMNTERDNINTEKDNV